MLRRGLLPLAFAVAALPFVAGSAARAGQVDWRRATDAAVVGGGYAAGEAIGTAAIGGQAGYDGGNPVGHGGNPGPSDRPCFTRRPVYNEGGTLIGYRGQQLC